jgi:hypothetical protein
MVKSSEALKQSMHFQSNSLSFGFCRRAHSESTKEWLSILDQENVPVLICLTFADKLFAELMGENGDCEIEKVKAEVERQLTVCMQKLV